MVTRYFELTDDKSLRDRWFLKSPRTDDGVEVDPRSFITGTPVEAAAPLYIPLRRPGLELDFTLADFSMPVVLREIAARLEAAVPGAVQRFPATVEGADREYDVVNVTHRVACLDEERSRITYWTHLDHRPELAGGYRMVLDLTVDPHRADACDIFRIAGWEVPLIVSARVREIMAGATGAVFSPVG